MKLVRRLSPDLQEKIHLFRKNRRAVWSTRLLLLLFLATLPAELLFNDKPIILSIDGRLYFPILKDYTYADLGGSVNAPVVNYRSQAFQDFLDGKEFKVNLDRIFPPLSAPGERIKKTNGAMFEQLPEVNRTHWAVFPPIPFSYHSFPKSENLERNFLASPLPHEVDGRRIPGAIREGHLLGTDAYGNDVLARIVYGLRLSLVFGVCVALTSTIIGIIIGGIQGYFGGWIDLAGQRLTEIWDAVPQLFLLMILSDFLARHLVLGDMQHALLLFVILNLTFWMGIAGQMRAYFLKGRSQDYVRAARALGVSHAPIMFRHIFPNSLTPIITFMPFAVAGGILALVSLDFLGFGMKYPAPSLGEMLAQGQNNLDAWWILTPTFLTLTLLLVLLTFVGDGVRNAFDPRYKG